MRLTLLIQGFNCEPPILYEELQLEVVDGGL